MLGASALAAGVALLAEAARAPSSMRVPPLGEELGVGLDGRPRLRKEAESCDQISPRRASISSTRSNSHEALPALVPSLPRSTRTRR